jgi:hypothetical protein
VSSKANNSAKKKKDAEVNDSDEDESDDNEDDEEEDESDDDVDSDIEDEHDNEFESTQLTHRLNDCDNNGGGDADEEQDLNLMRERELNELKCKSVAEKMSVFLDYYRQFREEYTERVQAIECTDSLRLQFGTLSKLLNEYEQVLAELNHMVVEHEREKNCKNNHRKTKKFFNKTKAFVRYECSKRLQASIFEYRR